MRRLPLDAMKANNMINFYKTMGNQQLTVSEMTARSIL